MRDDPGLPAPFEAPRRTERQDDSLNEAVARIGERRAFAAPSDSQTFNLTTRAGRELTVTLAAQPVFDLALSTPVARRIRRSVRHQGGEGALAGLARRTLEPADLQNIDLHTLRNGVDLLRLGSNASGVLPVFWRTVASSGGRFALQCAETARGAAPGTLLIEIMGGIEHAPLEAVQEAVERFGPGTGLILHVAPDPGAALRLAHVRAQCLVIDFAGVDHEHTRGWLAAAQLIGAAREACPQVMLLNLRPERGLDAEAAGATHAVFAGMRPLTV